MEKKRRKEITRKIIVFAFLFIYFFNSFGQAVFAQINLGLGSSVKRKFSSVSDMYNYTATLSPQDQFQFLNSSTVVCTRDSENVFTSDNGTAYRFLCFANNIAGVNLQLSLTVLNSAKGFDFIGYTASDDSAIRFDGYNNFDLKFTVFNNSRAVFSLLLASQNVLGIDATTNQGKIIFVNDANEFNDFLQSLHDTESVLFLKNTYKQIFGTDAVASYSVANVQGDNSTANALNSLSSSEIFSVANGQSLQKTFDNSAYTFSFDTQNKKINAQTNGQNIGTSDISMSFVAAPTIPILNYTNATNNTFAFAILGNNSLTGQAAKVISLQNVADYISQSVRNFFGNIFGASVSAQSNQNANFQIVSPDTVDRTKLNNFISQADAQVVAAGGFHFRITENPNLAVTMINSGVSTVATLNSGQIIGFQYSEFTSKTTGELIDIFVDSNYRGQGISTALVTNSINEMLKQNQNLKTVVSSVVNDPTSIGIQTTLPNLGFQETSRTDQLIKYSREITSAEIKAGSLLQSTNSQFATGTQPTATGTNAEGTTALDGGSAQITLTAKENTNIEKVKNALPDTSLNNSTQISLTQAVGTSTIQNISVSTPFSNVTGRFYFADLLESLSNWWNNLLGYSKTLPINFKNTLAIGFGKSAFIQPLHVGDEIIAKVNGKTTLFGLIQNKDGSFSIEDLMTGTVTPLEKANIDYIVSIKSNAPIIRNGNIVLFRGLGNLPTDSLTFSNEMFANGLVSSGLTIYKTPEALFAAIKKIYPDVNTNDIFDMLNFHTHQFMKDENGQYIDPFQAFSVRASVARNYALESSFPSFKNNLFVEVEVPLKYVLMGDAAKKAIQTKDYNALKGKLFIETSSQSAYPQEFEMTYIGDYYGNPVAKDFITRTFTLDGIVDTNGIKPYFAEDLSTGQLISKDQIPKPEQIEIQAQPTPQEIENQPFIGTQASGNQPATGNGIKEVSNQGTMLDGAQVDSETAREQLPLSINPNFFDNLYYANLNPFYRFLEKYISQTFDRFFYFAHLIPSLGYQTPQKIVIDKNVWNAILDRTVVWSQKYQGYERYATISVKENDPSTMYLVSVEVNKYELSKTTALNQWEVLFNYQNGLTEISNLHNHPFLTFQKEAVDSNPSLFLGIASDLTQPSSGDFLVDLGLPTPIKNAVIATFYKNQYAVSVWTVDDSLLSLSDKQLINKVNADVNNLKRTGDPDKDWGAMNNLPSYNQLQQLIYKDFQQRGILTRTYFKVINFSPAQSTETVNVAGLTFDSNTLEQLPSIKSSYIRFLSSGLNGVIDSFQVASTGALPDGYRLSGVGIRASASGAQIVDLLETIDTQNINHDLLVEFASDMRSLNQNVPLVVFSADGKTFAVYNINLDKVNDNDLPKITVNGKIYFDTKVSSLENAGIVTSLQVPQLTGEVPELSDSQYLSSYEVFYKKGEVGKTIEEKGEEYSVEVEFKKLQDMYAVAPQNVPKPLKILYDENNNPMGYFTQRVDGYSLVQYSIINNGIPQSIADQMRQILQKFHSNNIIHGDINAGNIIITSDGIVYFIDPSGIQSTKSFADQETQDNQNLDKLITGLNKFTSPGTNQPTATTGTISISYASQSDLISGTAKAGDVLTINDNGVYLPGTIVSINSKTQQVTVSSLGKTVTVAFNQISNDPQAFLDTTDQLTSDQITEAANMATNNNQVSQFLDQTTTYTDEISKGFATLQNLLSRTKVSEQPNNFYYDFGPYAELLDAVSWSNQAYKIIKSGQRAVENGGAIGYSPNLGSVFLRTVETTNQPATTKELINSNTLLKQFGYKVISDIHSHPPNNPTTPIEYYLLPSADDFVTSFNRQSDNLKWIQIESTDMSTGDTLIASYYFDGNALQKSGHLQALQASITAARAAQAEAIVVGQQKGWNQDQINSYMFDLLPRDAYEQPVYDMIKSGFLSPHVERISPNFKTYVESDPNMESRIKSFVNVGVSGSQTTGTQPTGTNTQFSSITNQAQQMSQRETSESKTASSALPNSQTASAAGQIDLAGITRQMIDQSSQQQTNVSPLAGITAQASNQVYLNSLFQLSIFDGLLQDAVITKANILFSSPDQAIRNSDLFNQYRIDMWALYETIANMNLGPDDIQMLRNGVMSNLDPGNIQQLVPRQFIQNINTNWQQSSQAQMSAIEDSYLRKPLASYASGTSKTAIAANAPWNSMTDTSTKLIANFYFANHVVGYKLKENGNVLKTVESRTGSQVLETPKEMNTQDAALDMEKTSVELDAERAAKQVKITVSATTGGESVTGGSDTSEVNNDIIFDKSTAPKVTTEVPAEIQKVAANNGGDTVVDFNDGKASAESFSSLDNTVRSQWNLGSDWQISVKLNLEAEKWQVTATNVNTGETKTGDISLDSTGKTSMQLSVDKNPTTGELEASMKNPITGDVEKGTIGIAGTEIPKSDSGWQISVDKNPTTGEWEASAKNINSGETVSGNIGEETGIPSSPTQMSGNWQLSADQDLVTGKWQITATNLETGEVKTGSIGTDNFASFNGENPATGVKTSAEMDAAGNVQGIAENAKSQITSSFTQGSVKIQGTINGNPISIEKPFTAYTKPELEGIINDARLQGKAIDVYTKTGLMKVNSDGSVDTFSSEGTALDHFTTDEVSTAIIDNQLFAGDSTEAVTFDSTEVPGIGIIGDVVFSSLAVGLFAIQTVQILSGQTQIGTSTPQQFQNTISLGVGTAYAAIGIVDLGSVIGTGTSILASSMIAGPAGIAIGAALAIGTIAAPFAFANNQLTGTPFSGPNGVSLFSQTVNALQFQFSGQTNLLAGNPLFNQIYGQEFQSINSQYGGTHIIPAHFVSLGKRGFIAPAQTVDGTASAEGDAMEAAYSKFLFTPAKTVTVGYPRIGYHGVVTTETTGDLWNKLASPGHTVAQALQWGQDLQTAYAKIGITSPARLNVFEADLQMQAQIDANNAQIAQLRTIIVPTSGRAAAPVGLAIGDLIVENQRMQGTINTNNAGIGNPIEGDEVTSSKGQSFISSGAFSFDSATNSYNSLDGQIHATYDPISGMYNDNGNLYEKVNGVLSLEGTETTISTDLQAMFPTGAYQIDSRLSPNTKGLVHQINILDSTGKTVGVIKTNNVLNPGFGPNAQGDFPAGFQAPKPGTTTETITDGQGNIIGKYVQVGGRMVPTDVSISIGGKSYLVAVTQDSSGNYAGAITVTVNENQKSYSVKMTVSIVGGKISISFTDPVTNNHITQSASGTDTSFPGGNIHTNPVNSFGQGTFTETYGGRTYTGTYSSTGFGSVATGTLPSGMNFMQYGFDPSNPGASADDYTAGTNLHTFENANGGITQSMDTNNGEAHITESSTSSGSISHVVIESGSMTSTGQGIFSGTTCDAGVCHSFYGNCENADCSRTKCVSGGCPNPGGNPNDGNSNPSGSRPQPGHVTGPQPGHVTGPTNGIGRGLSHAGTAGQTGSGSSNTGPSQSSGPGTRGLTINSILNSQQISDFFNSLFSSIANFFTPNTNANQAISPNENATSDLQRYNSGSQNSSLNSLNAAFLNWQNSQSNGTVFIINSTSINSTS